jgi:hypothetical protein
MKISPRIYLPLLSMSLMLATSCAAMQFGRREVLENVIREWYQSENDPVAFEQILQNKSQEQQEEIRRYISPYVAQRIYLRKETPQDISCLRWFMKNGASTAEMWDFLTAYNKLATRPKIFCSILKDKELQEKIKMDLPKIISINALKNRMADHVISRLTKTIADIPSQKIINSFLESGLDVNLPTTIYEKGLQSYLYDDLSTERNKNERMNLRTVLAIIELFLAKQQSLRDRLGKLRRQATSPRFEDITIHHAQ